MPSEDDIALDEKRVYGDTRQETAAYVSAALGVARVEIAGDQIGRFSLERSCTATAIAGRDGRLVVGTETDVLLGTEDGFAATDFGPASAVAVADGTPVAAGPDGAVARLVGDSWERVGTVERVHRMDGDLLAASDGVYRVGASLSAVDLAAAVRDVAAAGPYAATAEGLVTYNGDAWRRVAGGDCTLVAADGTRAHAVSDDGLLARRDGDWQVRELPVDAAVADLTHGESLYAVTVDGTFLVFAPSKLTPDGRGGWGSRALGVREVTGVAVP